MPGKAVDDVRLLLLHALNEKEHIKADLEDGARGADVVVAESEIAQTEVWNRLLLVLATIFNAQVVNLDEAAVALLEELTNFLATITQVPLETFGREAHRDDLVGDVGQVEVVALRHHTMLVLRDERTESDERIVAAATFSLRLFLFVFFDGLPLFFLSHFISDRFHFRLGPSIQSLQGRVILLFPGAQEDRFEFLL